MQGMFTYASKDYSWSQQGKRYVCADLRHPGGTRAIRFRSADAMETHVKNMRGKALTHTHTPCRSAQKNRRNRGRK